MFEISRTIYSKNSERSEQFLVTECVFNLLLKKLEKQFRSFLGRWNIVHIEKLFWYLNIVNTSRFELNKLRNSNNFAHLWLATYQSKIQKSNINVGLSQGNHLASLNGTCECLFPSQARIHSIFICTSM